MHRIGDFKIEIPDYCPDGGFTNETHILLVFLLITAWVQAAAADGKQIYESAKCGQCHSLSGEGNKKRPLDSFLAVALSKVDPSENLKEAMKSHGPKPAKVRIPSPMSDGDIMSLVAYFRSVLPEYGALPTDEDLKLIRKQLVQCRTVGEPMEPFCLLDGYCGWNVTAECIGSRSTSISVTNVPGSVPKYSTAVEWAEFNLFVRNGKYLNLARSLDSDNFFHHDASGATIQVTVAVDDAFKGWRRTLTYPNTRGIDYFCRAALDKVGFTEDRNKTSSDLLLTVRLLEIKAGAFGNKFPSTAIVKSTLKRASDSTIIFDKEFEGKGVASMGWTKENSPVARGASSFNVAMGDVAFRVAEEVLRTVTDKQFQGMK